MTTHITASPAATRYLNRRRLTLGLIGIAAAAFAAAKFITLYAAAKRLSHGFGTIGLGGDRTASDPANAQHLMLTRLG